MRPTASGRPQVSLTLFFVQRTPISEQCRGVVTTLTLLGLGELVERRDIKAIRAWFASQDPEAYTDLVVEYMSAQVDAGAHALQVFEAMGMTLGRHDFEVLALPHLESLATKLKARHPDVPLLVFARGVEDPAGVNAKLQRFGYDVITLDTAADRAASRSSLGAGQVLQGNLDPKLLLADGSSEAKLHDELEAMLRALSAWADGFLAQEGGRGPEE